MNMHPDGSQFPAQRRKITALNAAILAVVVGSVVGLILERQRMIRGSLKKTITTKAAVRAHSHPIIRKAFEHSSEEVRAARVSDLEKLQAENEFLNGPLFEWILDQTVEILESQGYFNFEVDLNDATGEWIIERSWVISQVIDSTVVTIESPGLVSRMNENPRGRILLGLDGVRVTSDKTRITLSFSNALSHFYELRYVKASDIR
jgi:hypothetical protein